MAAGTTRYGLSFQIQTNSERQPARDSQTDAKERERLTAREILHNRVSIT